MNGISRNTVLGCISPMVTIPSFAVSLTMDCAPSINTFASSYTDKTTGIAMSLCNPFSELVLKIIIPHFFSKEREIYIRHRIAGNILYPKLTFACLVWPPIRLEHARTRRYLKWHAHVINIRHILKFVKRPCDIIGRQGVLSLVVHVENAKSRVALFCYHGTQL